MAELNQKQPETGKKKIRSKKLAPKVDLTAMVDLAFLLITFFMLTTSLNKPSRLDVVMPDNSPDKPLLLDERRVVSLLLSDKGVMWYHGDFNHPISKPEHTDLTEKGIRAVLNKMKLKIPSLANGKDMIVLIKPSKEACTNDVVQALDEMTKVNIKRYSISKISPDEEKLVLASL
ncbi:biopolymer transporter ExbD [Sphingobacterium sp. SRCM116780]|uniref:ExbD/TolR family protein n=1 Tax=Sphingobacterium sp. SRCM116780 TaxID=2907623 RepID=UPI001F3EBF8C|nr:biopolymer transporter ExbD [Sphingobacterium sp. SRCM116780]UIR57701.1 biopolymer transporter ExbD [Sphingobacterium sp. SRCM116780]